jgi:Leucine-rich repeat (LRR) protein
LVSYNHFDVINLLGNSFAETLNCSQYADDHHVLNSLPFNVSILDNSTSCQQIPACARINAQNQVYDLALDIVPVALQVYCLKHLQSLAIFGYITEHYWWPIPYEIGTLTKLTLLSLSYINGDVIPETIGELKLLRTLYLLGTDIKQLTGAISALPNLSDLTIHAPLVELPSFLSILPLRNLGIINGQFTTIPENFFRNLNPTLLSLSIDISHLVNLDPFADLTKLTTFAVTVDGLSVFPWQFTYMTNLKDLRFQGLNCLSALPQNFSRAVTYLDLYKNCFAEIPTPLLLSKTLTSLDMSYNQIADLSSLALSRSPLSFVFLPFNQIQYIPPEIINLSDSLDYLALYSNRLTTLPAEEMVKMKKLTGLDVSFNNINSTERERLKSIFAANPNITVYF